MKENILDDYSEKISVIVEEHCDIPLERRYIVKIKDMSIMELHYLIGVIERVIERKKNKDLSGALSLSKIQAEEGSLTLQDQK